MNFKNTFYTKLLYILYFIYSFLFVASSYIFFAEKKSSRSPNINIYVADDTSWNIFGQYGNTVIQIPIINKLAEDELTVKKAFLILGQSNPFRISLLTGMYPHIAKAKDLHIPKREYLQIVLSFFQEIGYFTGQLKITHYRPHEVSCFIWYINSIADSFSEFLDVAGQNPYFVWVGFTELYRSYLINHSIEKKNDPHKVNVPPYLVQDVATQGDLVMNYDEITRIGIKSVYL